MTLQINKKRAIMKNIEIFASKEMSLSEKQVLMWFNEQDKPIVAGNKDIADAVGLHPRGVFNNIKSLEKKGFIRKNVGAGELKHYARCNTYDVLK
jgi:DNA-binding MarR family transcriptional regulator